MKIQFDPILIILLGLLALIGWVGVKRYGLKFFTTGQKIMLVLAVLTGAVLVGKENDVVSSHFAYGWYILAGIIAVPYTALQLWNWGYWKGRIDEDVEQSKNKK